MPGQPSPRTRVTSTPSSPRSPAHRDGPCSPRPTGPSPPHELHDGVHRAAALLTAHGVTRGDTVALLTGNRPEALVARYGANLLGARVVHLAPAAAPAMSAGILDATDTALLLVDPAAAAAARALPAGPRAPARLSLDPGLFTGAPAGEPVRTVGAARPEDDWCLRSTGGTTGPPKLVRLAHGPYRKILDAHTAHIPSAAPVRFLACTSLAHMAWASSPTRPSSPPAP